MTWEVTGSAYCTCRPPWASPGPGWAAWCHVCRTVEGKGWGRSACSPASGQWWCRWPRPPRQWCRDHPAKTTPHVSCANTNIITWWYFLTFKHNLPIYPWKKNKSKCLNPSHRRPGSLQVFDLERTAAATEGSLCFFCPQLWFQTRPIQSLIKRFLFGGHVICSSLFITYKNTNSFHH